MPAPIELLFDFVSPYAFVAFHAIQPIAARHGRTLELTPVLFAGLLQAHGQKGPAEIPAKRAYLVKDVYRKAARAGLDFAPPAAHPFNPLLALRVASLPMSSAQRVALVHELFRATWGGGEGVETPAAVEACAARAGLDGASLVQAAAAEPAKRALRDATDRAIAAGAFGVPTAVADGELFWGVDALVHLDDFLGGVDPVPASLVARWTSLPSTASRIARRDPAP